MLDLNTASCALNSWCCTARR